MSTPEDEYFARIEAEKKRRMAAQLADVDAEQAAADKKAAHYMHCGKCGEEMMTTHFKGVEIEICPGCGAVLLDPGELQQLAGEDRGRLLGRLAGIFGISGGVEEEA